MTTAGQSPPGRRRGRALLAGGALLLATLGVVATLRWSGERARPDPEWLVADEESCYVAYDAHNDLALRRDPPGLGSRVVTDERGLRVPAARPPPGEGCRLLALGDSFTFGLWVEAEQAWPARLEARLRAAGYRVVVENAGVPGHTISQERVAALARYQEPPATVLLVGLTAGDLSDLVRVREASCDPWRIPAGFVPSRPSWGPDVEHRHDPAGPGPQRPRVSERLARAVGGGPEPSAEACPAAVASWLELATDLTRRTVAANRRLLILELERPLCAGASAIELEAQARERAAVIRAAGGEVANLRTALLEPGSTLAPADGHPSPAGHDRIATQAAAELVRSGWLEGCR